MSSGFHRLGCSVPGKVTGYHASSPPIGLVVAAKPVLPVPPTPKSTAPAIADTLIAGESLAPGARTQPLAVGGGYTGDQCDSCGSARMRRNGSCLVCDDCGTTTGCS